MVQGVLRLETKGCNLCGEKNAPVVRSSKQSKHGLANHTRYTIWFPFILINQSCNRKILCFRILCAFAHSFEYLFRYCFSPVLYKIYIYLIVKTYSCNRIEQGALLFAASVCKCWKLEKDKTPTSATRGVGKKRKKKRGDNN